MIEPIRATILAKIVTAPHVIIRGFITVTQSIVGVAHTPIIKTGRRMVIIPSIIPKTDRLRMLSLNLLRSH